MSAGNHQVNDSVITAINTGDERSFKVLYDAYYSYLCACATTYVIDGESAREIVNDLFVNVWRNRASLRFPIHAYLLQGVRNGCLNHLRSLSSERINIERYGKEMLDFRTEYAETDRTPIEYVETEELRGIIEKAVGELPDRCRAIFTQYLYNGKSPKEIAEENDLSVNTVRVQIKIAFDKLRARLGTSLLIMMMLWH